MDPPNLIAYISLTYLWHMLRHARRNTQEPTLLAKLLQPVGSAQLKGTPHYASNFYPSNSVLPLLSSQYKKNRMYN